MNRIKNIIRKVFINLNINSINNNKFNCKTIKNNNNDNNNSNTINNKRNNYWKNNKSTKCL